MSGPRRNQLGNLRARDNYVYRWSRRQLETLLRSLYLESGFSLDVTVGWMSARAQVHKPRWVRRLSTLVGYAASFVPGASGNLATVLIEPGGDLPPDPMPPESR